MFFFGGWQLGWIERGVVGEWLRVAGPVVVNDDDPNSLSDLDSNSGLDDMNARLFFM
jgi:hypothetical protein